MGMCKKCAHMCGWLFVIAAVLFLLVDLGIWNFWGISWWTVVLALLGLGKIGYSKCKNCK